MYIPKKYGQSKVDKCPFCQKQATAKNKQGMPVCQNHMEEALDDMKCVCGSTLDMLNGKFGIFFSCAKCGNMNLRKVMEFNMINPKAKNINEIYTQRNAQFQNKKESQTKKETIVRSDDPRYFD